MIELIGQRFGRLTVLSEQPNRCGLRYWLCRCDCGSEHVTVYQGSLRRKNNPTTSCGCYHRERAKANATHGQASRGAKSVEYNTWRNVKERCYNNKSTSYRNYGARGIRMAQEWVDDFPKFLSDIGVRPSAHHSIERIDNNGNYEPSNVRWATKSEQAQNTRFTRRITFNGLTKTITEWANAIGIQRSTLSNRIKHDWSPERAITTPVRM